jgi:glycosyltransferase involved in cell wall biosynthesis
MPSPREPAWTNNGWESKLPPVLAVCYAAALLYDLPPASMMRRLALVVFVGLCAGSYCHIVNDAFEIDADRIAGKPNRMARFAPWQRFALCALTLGLGFAPAIYFPYSRLNLGLLAMAYLLPTLHSIPPLRFKERGALGILVDSMGGYAVPCLYAFSVMANEAARPAARFAWMVPALAAVSFVWALCLGTKCIVIHQIQDRASDIQAGATSLAKGRELHTIRLRVNRIYGIELFAFGGILLVLFPVSSILLTVAAAYFVMLYVKVSRHRDFFVCSGKMAATLQWWQFSHPFYECYFPLVLAAQVAWRYPWLAFLPVVQVLAFKKNFYCQFGELRFFLGGLPCWIVWRAQFHLDGGAEASMRLAGLDCSRIRIRLGGSQPWHIRIVKTYGALRVAESYQVRLELRSGKPRLITLGVWQNHTPWMHLGLNEVVQISPKWETIERTFFATEDEEHAYLGLWLGGKPGTVDIKCCTIARVKPAGLRESEQAPPGPRAAYRIFVGATQWNLTGVNVYSEHLVRGLQSQGADARILLTERQTDRVQHCGDLISVPADVRVVDLPVAASASWSARWVALVRYLYRQAPCIFIPNADYRHSCVSPKFPAGVCIVGIVHSDDPLHYDHVARLGRYWDAIVCVSDTIARKVAEMDVSFIPRLHVISNGLPVPDRLPERVLDASDSALRLRVMYHGGLNTRQKRILDIAAILDECARRGIPIRVTVAGEGTERDALLRACDPHLSSGAFEYVGLLPHGEIESLLREHDVYLLPSAFEGLPYALLEAMAHGCVPLVTDIESAVPELIRHGVNGYRVPVGDISSFADYLGVLQADPERRDRLRVESHRTVLGSRYDVRAMVDSYLRLFEQVLEAARSGTYRRPAGPISPPPREVAGISIFPMDHEREVENAERWLMTPREQAALRVRRLLSHFT